MGEFSPNVSEVELRAAIVEDALRPGGVAYDVAQQALSEPVELTPHEAGDVILPPKQPGEAKEARWQLLEGSKDAIKTGAQAREAEIFELAESLDMRRTESVGEQDIARINPDCAIFAIEPGANKTSAVRRSIAVEVAQRIYGARAEQVTLHQFGSERAIPRERGGKENAEYKIAQQVAGDHLPDDDSLTEFGLNMASALQDGYEVVSDLSETEVAQRQVRMQKAGMPQLELIQPYKLKGGFEDAFTALGNKYGNLEGAQFVIATNGQYRPKDEQQAAQWARRNEIDMLQPVAFGDEPGYTALHAGQVLETPERKAEAYLNEAVILDRLHKAGREN